MAVLENMEGEDAPALVPAPPDLSLDKLTLFDDMEGEDAGEPYSPNTTKSVSPQVANMMNLLRVAIYNISYIRGLFPEENFRDSSVPELEMTIKKLIPKDIESRRLIDWIDQGVYDAMEKKYLETVYFCICENDKGGTIDEYSFTFRYPNPSCEETTMEFSLAGSKGNGDIFMSNPTESASDQIRRLIRFSAKMMSSLDQIPDERTILMKLMYYDDVTPEDYEPPLFECFPDDEDDTNLVQSFGRLCFISQRAPVFLLDSGATHHICCDKSYLTDMRKISKEERIKLNTANNVNVMAKESGEIAIGNIHINQIRYIPGITFNLISIGYLDKQGLLISIVNSQFIIIDVSKSIHVGEGHRSRKNNDYILKAMRWKVQDEVELQQESRDGDDDDEDDDDDDATESWVIDSGCASHMAGNLGMLTNARSCRKEFYTPRGSMISTHKGSVINANVKLSDVSYCPANSNNILSVGVLDSQGYRFTFYNGLCTIVCKDTLEEVGWGMLNDNNLLYYLQRLETKDAISKKKWKR